MKTKLLVFLTFFIVNVAQSQNWKPFVLNQKYNMMYESNNEKMLEVYDIDSSYVVGNKTTYLVNINNMGIENSCKKTTLK